MSRAWVRSVPRSFESVRTTSRRSAPERSASERSTRSRRQPRRWESVEPGQGERATVDREGDREVAQAREVDADHAAVAEDRVGEVGADQLGAGEVDAGEDGVGEVGVEHLGGGQGAAVHPHPVEHRAAQPHAAGPDAVERRPAQVDPGEVELVEDAAPQHPRGAVPALEPVAEALGVGAAEVGVRHLGAGVEGVEGIGHGRRVCPPGPTARVPARPGPPPTRGTFNMINTSVSLRNVPVAACLSPGSPHPRARRRRRSPRRAPPTPGCGRPARCPSSRRPRR